jgi:hypothetical protein
MDDSVDVSDCFIKHALRSEVVDIVEVQQVGELGSGTEHALSLRLRTSNGPHPEPLAKQVVHNMSADQAGGAGDEDIPDGFLVSPVASRVGVGTHLDILMEI